MLLHEDTICHCPECDEQEFEPYEPDYDDEED